MVKEAVQRGVPFGWIGMDCHYEVTDAWRFAGLTGEQPWLLEEFSDLSVIYHKTLRRW